MSAEAGAAMPEGYIPPNVAPKCEWALGKDKSLSPHRHLPAEDPHISTTILPDILSMVGNTPLVRLDKIAKTHGLECDLLAKCEYFNAGGSVKDRIGLRMVLEAEKEGILKPGDTIIEPTSGNTGIGLALTAAVKGYRCVICLPEKMSNEKVSVLKALGAEVVRTPTKAAFNSPESHVGVAWRLKNEIPNSHILDQYRNAGNPLAHYDGTAAEILTQCGGKVDMIVCGAGTGGTVAGIGRKIKEVLPECQIVGVDPIGSILAEPEHLNEGGEGFPYQVEGIGYDFIPTVLDRSVVDKWYKSEDKESFEYARMLIREEGMLCGGSSGSALAAALKEAKSLKAGQKCVVLLPDSIRNYLTKFASDTWMQQQGYMVPEKKPTWWDLPVSSLNLSKPVTGTIQTTCGQAVEAMTSGKMNQLAITDQEGSFVGVVAISELTSKLVSGAVLPTDPVTKAYVKRYRRVDSDINLGRVSLMLDTDSFVVVAQKSGPVKKLEGIVTSSDVARFICSQQ